MSTLGVSRSGRVRKKSAKVVEMENFDGEGGDDHPRPTGAASGGHHPQSHAGRSPSAARHQPYLDSSGNESSSRSPQAPLSSTATARKSVPATSPPMTVDQSSSSSSDSETDDSSENDSDSDELPYPLQKVTAQQMVQLQALQKGRRPKQAAPQRSRQYSSSSAHEYDPPYNPKTGAGKMSTTSTSAAATTAHKPQPRRQPHGPLHAPQQRTAQPIGTPQHAPQQKVSQQQHHGQALRLHPADSELSSSNEEEDSDEESDSGDSLIIDSGDGFAKKAPIRKLNLPLATAAALASAQRQKMRQRLEEVDEEPSEDNDDDDDDFVPSSAKRRRPSAQAGHQATPGKKPSVPPPEKRPEPADKAEFKKPKTPSAYVMYCSDIRKKLLAENPSLTFAELSKRMGHMWNLLPEKDKQLWKRKAKSLQAKNASGLITTGKQPASAAPTQNKAKTTEKKPPTKPTHPPPQKTPPAAKTKTPAPPVPKPIPAKNSPKTPIAKSSPKAAITKTKTTASSTAAPAPSASSNLQALISNYQELLDKPVEPPPRPFGHSPLDAAAHLKLLGESLTTIGTNLMEHQGPIAVSGSLSVLLDSTLCALGPLVCLTAQLDELDGSRPETLQSILNNIAYIMPGL
ncbi:HMG domain-containing protein 4-like [Tropilaelaps mercedesae]|uniref:HMG domain-containing protein 4-like n=1 Tax=Tropilaelaps mercedesae TaxID=418985 RepID=A0A1V9WY17_9ACAR|nr:HMG domain-containing protein 4-like [Tropilaelaps mercedesae]